MMKKALSVALCILMAGTVLTACSNPDEFSDSENLSLKYTHAPTKPMIHSIMPTVQKPPRHHMIPIPQK